MADNRMYLIHIESGLGAYIGRRSGYEWYSPAGSAECLERLYQKASMYAGIDGFLIVKEDDWKEWITDHKPKPDGLYQFRREENA